MRRAGLAPTVPPGSIFPGSLILTPKSPPEAPRATRNRRAPPARRVARRRCPGGRISLSRPFRIATRIPRASRSFRRALRSLRRMPAQMPGSRRTPTTGSSTALHVLPSQSPAHLGPSLCRRPLRRSRLSLHLARCARRVPLCRLRSRRAPSLVAHLRCDAPARRVCGSTGLIRGR